MSQPVFEVRTPSFLLLRPDDHLIAGVTWSEVRAAPASAPILTAGRDAWLLLALPPQHVAEQTFPDALPGVVPDPEARAQSMLSGTSQVGVRLAPDADFEPTASSILALLDTGAALGPDGAPGQPRTLVELPWHLIVEPRTRQGQPAALRTASPTPGSPAAGSALWRLRADGGDEARTALAAVAEVAADAPDPFTMALERAFRARLVAQTAVRPADLDRLELTALGGR